MKDDCLNIKHEKYIKHEKLYDLFFHFLLTLLICLFLTSYQYIKKPQQPHWARLAMWSMFTNISRYHSDLKVEVYKNQKWSTIDLRKLFPSTWDSGFRYQRHVFWRNKTRMRTLAGSICHRLDLNSEKIMIYKEVWPIILGVKPEVKENLRRTNLLKWNCTNPVYRPNGKRINGK